MKRQKLHTGVFGRENAAVAHQKCGRRGGAGLELNKKCPNHMGFQNETENLALFFWWVGEKEVRKETGKISTGKSEARTGCVRESYIKLEEELRRLVDRGKRGRDLKKT